MATQLSHVGKQLQQRVVYYSKAPGSKSVLVRSRRLTGDDAEALCLEWIALEIARSGILETAFLVAPKPRLSVNVATWVRMGDCMVSSIGITQSEKVAGKVETRRWFVQTAAHGNNRIRVECYSIGNRTKKKPNGRTSHRRSLATVRLTKGQRVGGFDAVYYEISLISKT